MKTVHQFGYLNQDDADKDLQPGQCRSIRNMLPAKRGTGLRREVVRGNVKLPGVEDFFDALQVSLGDFDLSQIEVIGSFVSTEANIMYVFYKNPNYIVKIEVANDGSYNYDFIPFENRFIWNFDNIDGIYNVSLINDKLHWCQPNGEQYIIDINKDYTGSISDFNDFINSQSDQRKLLYLQKNPPLFPLNTEGINTGEDTNDKSREYLEDKSLMFTYRYIYDTDDVSPFAPWSEAHPAFRIKKKSIQAEGAVLEAALADYNLNPRFYKLEIGKRKVPLNVKSIQFASIDQEESFAIFKTLDREASWTNDSAPNIEVEYTGNDLESPVNLGEALKIQQPNPFNPKTSVGFDDRIFQSGGQVGLPIKESLTLDTFFTRVDGTTTTYSENGLTKLWSRKPLFKSGGRYKVGVQFYDENFKRSFVSSERNISVPMPNDYGERDRYRLSIRPSGSFPGWAKYFQFVRSDITNYIVYTATKGIILNYISENAEGTVLEDNQFLWQDRVYRSEANPSEDDYSSTHVLLPQNLPFEIDNTYKIRFLNDDLYMQEFPILEVIGDIAVIEKHGKTTNTLEYIVEVFKENFDEVEILNEVGGVYDVAEWNQFKEIPGDTYLVGSKYAKGANVVFNNFNPTEGQNAFTAVLKAEIASAERGFTTTSQTTTIRQNTGFTTRLETEAEKTGQEFRLKNITATEWALQVLSPIGIAINIKNKAGVEPVYKNKITQKYANMVVNYDLAISSKGRPNVVYKNEREVTLDSSIYFSDPAIQGSKVNGLSNFQANNVYVLPSERGPIVTLVPIDSSNVMLALHPRKTTSLYIGEGFIRQGQDSILAKTEGVIGDDRPLRGEYGTINPESVTVYNGTAIWWDQNQKEIVRYGNNGLTPLGLVYKMRTYLEDWGKRLENGNHRVLTGYDPHYECFFIKFPTTQFKESETLYFRNVQGEGFVATVDHQGESFCVLQDEFVSLKGQDIYRSSNTKEFYGNAVKPTRSVEFIHNDQPMVTKVYENLAINSDAPWAAEITNNRGQLTDMLEKDYRLFEDTYYTEVLRDKNTPDDVMKPGQIKLRDGRLIKSQSANIELSSDDANELNEVVVEASVIQGQYL